MRELEVWILRYVPNVVRGEQVNIGVLIHEGQGDQFGEARFVSDWEKVSHFDPYADLELLDALQTEIKKIWINPRERLEFLCVAIDGSWSNTLQLSSREVVATDEPSREVERLAQLYLH